MKLTLISKNKKSKAAIDGETAAVVDLLREIANALEHGDDKVVGGGVVLAFADSNIATVYEGGSNPAQLVGACEQMKLRLLYEMVDTES